MPFFKIIFFCLLLMGQSAVALAEEELLPPDQAFKISAKAVTSDQLEISWEIAEGYYLYQNKMQFKSKTEQIQKVTPVFPAGETKHDDFFGNVIIYRNTSAHTCPFNNGKPSFFNTTAGAIPGLCR